MANEQVRIDLTANDQASKKIDDVADAAEAVEKLDPEVQITADDRATDDLAAIRDDAEALDRLDPEVAVGADVDAARRGIADIRDDAEALTRADAEIVLRAKVDAAKANLADLRAELKQTADRADDTNRKLDNVDRGGGSGLRGNAIADLTGPLGEASGAASDFAGVFDGLGDISEGVAAKVGVSAGAMAGAIGGIGVAVAAGAAAWTYFRQKQEEARRKQRELTDAAKDFLEAYRTGNVVEATDKMVDKWGDLLALADKLDVSIADVTAVLTGQATEVPGLEQKTKDLYDQWARGLTLAPEQRNALLDQYDAYKKLTGQVDDAAQATANGSDELAQHERITNHVRSALDRASDSTDDFTTAQDRAREATDATNAQLERMRGALDMEQAIINWRDTFAQAMNDNEQTMDEQATDVLNLKQAIIDAGEAVGKSPWQIQTELDKVDEGDMQQVKADVEAWYRLYPITVASKLDRPGQISGGLTGTSGGPRSVVESTIVNMTLPAGWRGDPIRAAHTQRRRVGRYFARTA